MKCARLHLQARSKPPQKQQKQVSSDKPKRYCQKRLVNPDHDEDPRWAGSVLERFHCNIAETIHGYFKEPPDEINNLQYHQNEDLFLTVQNLKFQGDSEERKRPRTSFKYRSVADGNKHRMFVKQTVDVTEGNEEDRSSQLTCYYFDDYVKYLISSDMSRPSTAKSNIRHEFNKDKLPGKPTQEDIKVANNKLRQNVIKPKKNVKNIVNSKQNNNIDLEINTDNTKISFEKSGKRKSLTISRAQSPETVQVIRVDVVCNFSNSSMIYDCDDTKKEVNKISAVDSKIDNVGQRTHHFADKYLLTNTIKKLDENTAGAKVTLLCKTFKLADRSKHTGKKSIFTNAPFKNIKNGNIMGLM